MILAIVVTAARALLRAAPSMVLATPPSPVSAINTMPGSPERWLKSTKQVATLGPASSTPEMLEKLFAAGVDVFRLNFSHGRHAEKAELIRMIRDLEAKYSQPIAILADLQGPKLRVGIFEHDKPGRMEAGAPVIAGHKSAVLDFDFNPFHEHLIATGTCQW